MKVISNNVLNTIVDDNESIFQNEKSVKTIFLNDSIINNFDFSNQNSLLFDGLNLIFKNCTFINCHLNDSSLKMDSLIQNCLFFNSNLSKVFFEGKIINSRFIECNFFEAEFVGIEIEQCWFVNCNFSSFYLASNNIKGSKFIHNKWYNEDCIQKNNENNVEWYPLIPS